MHRLPVRGRGYPHGESPSVSDTLQSLPVSVAATINFAKMQTKAVNDCYKFSEL